MQHLIHELTPAATILKIWGTAGQLILMVGLIGWCAPGPLMPGDTKRGQAVGWVFAVFCCVVYAASLIWAIWA